VGVRCRGGSAVARAPPAPPRRLILTRRAATAQDYAERRMRSQEVISERPRAPPQPQTRRCREGSGRTAPRLYRGLPPPGERRAHPGPPGPSGIDARWAHSRRRQENVERRHSARAIAQRFGRGASLVGMGGKAHFLGRRVLRLCPRLLSPGHLAPGHLAISAHKDGQLRPCVDPGRTPIARPPRRAPADGQIGLCSSSLQWSPRHRSGESAPVPQAPPGMLASMEPQT
jgi:hypothetical protein